MKRPINQTTPTTLTTRAKPGFLPGIIVIIVLLVSSSQLVWAQSAVSGVPNLRLRYPSLGLSQYILGSSCLSLRSGPMDLDCNPAYLAGADKTIFRASVAANNQVSTVNDYREQLDKGDSIGMVNSLLNQSGPMQAEATSAIWYQHDWWAVGYVPFSGGFASYVQNPAYPTVSADVFKESSLFAKAGFVSAGDENLQFGVQARYVERQFFHQQFDLLDVIGSPGSLQIQGQKVFYLEPGVNYQFDGNWESEVSATLTRVAIYQTGAQDPFSPVIDIGLTTSPPFADGHFRTTTHYSNSPEITDVLSRFTQGAIFDFGKVASVSASLGKSSVGLGVNGHYQSVELGVGWRSEDISPDQWNTVQVSTYIFEAGLVF